MIPFEEIDPRLDSIGKNRVWLAEVSGRSYNSIRSALAPNSPDKQRSSLLQRALSDAIEREEELQRSALDEKAIEDLKQHAITVYPTREQFNRWCRAFKNSEADTMEEWAESGLDQMAEEWMNTMDSAFGSSTMVQMPQRPHIEAAAGAPIGAEVQEWEGADDTVMVRINGLSMVPLFNDGEVIPMRHKRAARNKFMKKGLIYLVEYDGGYTVKEYNTRLATPEEIADGISYISKEDDKHKVRILKSRNPEYPEIVIKTDAEWIAWFDPKKA